MNIVDVPHSILALLTALDGRADDWPEPEALARPLKSVQPFDSGKLLPSILKDRCSDISHRMRCAPEFPAVAAICALGSVIGAGCGIRPKQKDDWTEVPNLWGGVVARPGSLKTPAINDGFSALRAAEADADEAYEQEKNAYQLEQLGKKVETEAIKKRLTKASAEPNIRAGADFTRFKELHGKASREPQLRRFRTNDSTVEMLGDILSRNERGLLVHRDELIGLLMSFEAQGHEGDRGFYLEGWNGQHRYRVDRVGRGEVLIPHHCISVFGGIQPQKLQQYLYAMKASGNDGFLQRFQMLVYPDDVPARPHVDESPNGQAADRLEDVVKKLAGMDFAAAGATVDRPGGIPFLRFDAKRAQPAFFSWLENLERVIEAEENPLIQEHLTKYRKLVPALALIFHLVEHAQLKRKTLSAVSLKCLQGAIAWAEFLTFHARRIYAMGFDSDVAAAERLASKLRSGELVNGFSERDVQRHDWAGLGDAELVSGACKELVAAGWIRKQVLERRGPGRPSATYDVNPAIVNGRLGVDDKTDDTAATTSASRRGRARRARLRAPSR